MDGSGGDAPVATVALPLSRLAYIERRRAARGECEWVGYLDEVAIPVRAPRAGDAPVALVATSGDDAGSVHAVWRAFGGRLYRPLWPRGIDLAGCAPARACEILARRARGAADNNGMQVFAEGGERVYDSAPLRHSTQGRGIGPEGHHPVRRTVDDGRAAQSAGASAIARRLLMVDGGLWHEAPMPGFVVRVDACRYSDPAVGWRDGLSVGVGSCLPYLDPVKGVSEQEPGPAWMTFPPDEGGEALAFADELAALLRRGGRDPGRVRGPGRQGFRVVDGDALAGVLGPRDAGSWIAKAGAEFLAATAKYLGGMGMDGVDAFREARAAIAEGRGPDAAFGAVRAFAGMLPSGSRPGSEAAVAVAALALRYEGYERHRAPRGVEGETADSLSLAGFAP